MNDEIFFRTTKRKRQTESSTFMPIFFDDLNVTEEAKELCEGNPECILDLVITGDKDIATNTLENEKQTNVTKDTISKINH